MNLQRLGDVGFHRYSERSVVDPCRMDEKEPENNCGTKCNSEFSVALLKEALPLSRLARRQGLFVERRDRRS